MEFNLTTLGILTAVWVFGYLLGLLEASLKKKPGRDVEPEDAEDAEGIPSPDGNKPEILSVFQRISGAHILRLDGEMIEYPSDVTPQQRRRLIDLLVAIRPWVDEEISTEVSATGTTTATPPAPVTSNEPEVEKSAAELSMVEQIDKILQKKLVGHTLEKRGIQLRASSSGGVIVHVGLDKYEWIDEIPERAIQEIIREASAEWEKNATPGL